ncbi:MAG: hypothetical protein GX329_01280 [Tissierellia bacterium]|nr:hypothetical protein [Tissierellia bacterium]
MYFTDPLPSIPKDIHEGLGRWSSTKKLISSALLAVLTSILQSAGGLLPGVGLFISPFSTMAILVSTVISLKHGIFSYILSIFLLMLMEPSELFIFPFTTGLLGLGIGWGLYNLNRRIAVILMGAITLSIGIHIPLYILKFPVFGPLVSSIPDMGVLMPIFGFALLYSWLWLELGLYVLRRLDGFLFSA